MDKTDMTYHGGKGTAQNLFELCGMLLWNWIVHGHVYALVRGGRSSRASLIRRRWRRNLFGIRDWRTSAVPRLGMGPQMATALHLAKEGADPGFR